MPAPATSADTAARWQRLAVAAVTALILLDILWEAWLAPLKPGGSWLVVKALPLLVVWPGLVRGAARARQWLALLLPLYLAEAIPRALTESGRHAAIAWVATVLIVVSFGAVLATFRRVPKVRAAPTAARRP